MRVDTTRLATPALRFVLPRLVAPSKKFTLPVGVPAEEDTVAVRVRVVWNGTGFADGLSAMPGVSLLTVSVSVELVTVLKLVSPEYTAVIE